MLLNLTSDCLLVRGSRLDVCWEGAAYLQLDGLSCKEEVGGGCLEWTRKTEF